MSNDLQKRAEDLFNLIYAHTVIKYDPPAGIRCCAKVLALLDKEVKRTETLASALQPFGGTFAEAFVDSEGWTGPMRQDRIVDWFGPSDFRNAHAAMAIEPAADHELPCSGSNERGQVGSLYERCPAPSRPNPPSSRIVSQGAQFSTGTTWRWVRSLFAWREVFRAGVWAYEENAVTGARRARRYLGYGYSPKATNWLEGRE